eukprot:PhF_6_TR23779/c1_g1_i1/m.33265/K14677/ACY1; aminoacylase
MSDCWEIQLYKEFLRLDTSHPNPNYTSTVEWLQRKSKDLGMECRVHELVQHNPIVILTKIGSDPALPAVAFNCHTDVVPVVPEKWTALPSGVTPFDAWEDPATGNIYARGSQDMKIAGAGFLCGMQRLVQKSVTLRRTVHFLFVPDEEVGGTKGMAPFVISPDFKALNIGVVIDEGLAHPDDKYMVYYGERHPWWGVVTANSAMGHGSKFYEDPTSVNKILTFARTLEDIHKKQHEKLKQRPGHEGEFTSVNITVLKAGVTKDGQTFQYNQIPGEASVGFDMRVPYDMYDDMMKKMEEECGNQGLTLNWLQVAAKSPPSPIGPHAAWLQALLRVAENHKVQTTTTIFPAATDSRFVRRIGVPAYGFTPLRKTPQLLHDHNEYVNRASFMEAVDVYENLIQELTLVDQATVSKI